MPVLDGFEIIRRIRAIADLKKIVIIVTSANERTPPRSYQAIGKHRTNG